jgi:hypothetical protein
MFGFDPPGMTTEEKLTPGMIAEENLTPEIIVEENQTPGMISEENHTNNCTCSDTAAINTPRTSKARIVESGEKSHGAMRHQSANWITNHT